MRVSLWKHQGSLQCCRSENVESITKGHPWLWIPFLFLIIVEDPSVLHGIRTIVLGAVTPSLFPSQLQLLLLPPFSHRSTGPFTSTYSIPSQFLLLLPNLTSVFKSFYISLISINFRIIACLIGHGVLVWWFWFCNIGDVFNWVYVLPIQLFVICDSEWYDTIWGAKLLDRLLFDSDSVNTYMC